MEDILSESRTMHGPAVYKIVVRDTLDSDRSSLLKSMSITERHTSSNKVETVLVGRLGDQAADQRWLILLTENDSAYS